MPRDLLREDVRAELISSCDMDGVSHGHVTPRAEWFAGVRIRISELNVAVSEFPPADLEYLCTLVNGIIGPGLPYRRMQRQFHFLTPYRPELLPDLLESVIIPVRNNGSEDGEGDGFANKKYNSLSCVWEDWDIAIAFKLGGGPHWGGSWALY